MTAQLPLWEGKHPDAATIALTGSVEHSDELATAHHLQETVYLIVEAQVTKVSHNVDANGLLHRVHAMRADRLAVLTPQEGGDLLTAQRKAAREAAGISELPMDTITDGVVVAVNDGAGPDATATHTDDGAEITITVPADGLDDDGFAGARATIADDPDDDLSDGR